MRAGFREIQEPRDQEAAAVVWAGVMRTVPRTLTAKGEGG